MGHSAKSSGGLRPLSMCPLGTAESPSLKDTSPKRYFLGRVCQDRFPGHLDSWEAG